MASIRPAGKVRFRCEYISTRLFQVSYKCSGCESGLEIASWYCLRGDWRNSKPSDMVAS